MDQLKQISDWIAAHVASSENGVVRGVHLGAALKKEFPQFVPSLYQSKNLRQFIKKYVPGVVEKQYTGVDVLYTCGTTEGAGETVTVPESIPGSEDDSTFISLPVPPVTWKAYSNPSFRVSIVANPETGEIRTIGEHDTAQSPWIPIPKLSSEVHRQIAREFSETLEDSAKAGSLKAVLADPQWYVSFFATAKRLGLSKQWGLFKREHLIRRFTAALHDHGIPAAPASPKHDYGPPRRSRAALHVSHTDDAAIREIVVRLAHTLPIDELRSIRMPIGFVLDAVKK